MGIAVVTGAASGIGMALARRLATRGHQVHLVDVAPTADLAAELAGVGHIADVASAEDMERVAVSAEEAEIVCLNAGIVGGSRGVPGRCRFWSGSGCGRSMFSVWSTGSRLSPLGCRRADVAEFSSPDRWPDS
jgi:NAD(P)-dependent dehydrogenase (short-subunit alcohol dehydrogenase family)